MLFVAEALYSFYIFLLPHSFVSEFLNNLLVVKWAK